MSSKWLEKYEVPGSRGETWTVGIDKDGNFGCSCPVWRFKRQECKHIDFVKNNPHIRGAKKDFLQAQPGNVGEVTIRGGLVLYPLVPFGPIQLHLTATIIFDMQRANVDPEIIRDYMLHMLKGKATFQAVNDYVRQNGRLVYSDWIEGKGWVNPVVAPVEAPIKADKE